MKISFEVFPPKVELGVEHIYSCLDGLMAMKPEFISVTYSAGDAKKGLTAEVCGAIKQKYGIRPVSHLTCAGMDEESLKEDLRILKDYGVDTILALRGDLTMDKKVGVFPHATDLMAAINRIGGFTLCGACYPEGHQESGTYYDDLTTLKRKYDLGVRTFISQLFFDNADYLRMCDKAKKACPDATFEAGIMPATNVRSLLRMVYLSGAKIPDAMKKIVDAYGADKTAMKEAGIEYAINQINDLKKEGCDYVHFYTMDNVDVTQKVIGGIEL